VTNFEVAFYNFGYLCVKPTFYKISIVSLRSVILLEKIWPTRRKLPTWHNLLPRYMRTLIQIFSDNWHCLQW
jgi:hypothetical protein